MRDERQKPRNLGEDTEEVLRVRETPKAGGIGIGDPGWTVSAQARMVLEQFTGEVGAQMVLLTAARFFVCGGGSSRSTNLQGGSVNIENGG